jgi:cell division protease FtsH
MARRMVTRFGMSDVIGLMAVGDSEQEVFLGRELGHRREVSEHTQQTVDQEVKRILDEAHKRARGVVEGNRDLLEAIATALLERETLDRAEIDALSRGETLPPFEPLQPEGNGQKPGKLKPGGDGDSGSGQAGGSRGPGRSIEGVGAVDSGERSSETQGEDAQHPSPSRVARFDG